MNRRYSYKNLRAAINPEPFPHKNFTGDKDSGKLWAALAITFTGVLLVFLFLLYLIVFRQNHVFDDAVSAFVTKNRSPFMVAVMRKFTFFGSARFLLPGYLLIISFLIYKNRMHEAVRIVLVSLGSWLLISGLKILIHRPRPELRLVNDITSYSFPSAHAFSSLVFFSVLAFIITKRQAPSFRKKLLIILLLVFPATIGLSRIILNVHYATDVIGGFCLAVLWLVLAYTFYHKREAGQV